MRHPRKISCVLLLLLLATSVAGVARADIVCTGDLCDLMVLLGITEEPDPVFWEEFDEGWMNGLNPGGAIRGDGPPGIAYHPETGWPVVTWAYNLGSSFEVVLVHWSPEGWSPLEFLTADAWDDLDPKPAFDDSGVLHVAWWHRTPDSSTVWTQFQKEGRDWSSPALVSENGARPSILRPGDRSWIAYESALTEGGKQIVLHTRGKGGPPTSDVLATTVREAPLDVELHTSQDKVWIDWKHSDTEFAYLEYLDGAWATEVTVVPWDDTSWLGVEVVRREIRAEIMATAP